MIGFNVREAATLASDIYNAYVNLGEEIKNGWPDVSKVFRDEWVGEDELSFEEQLVNKINSLYAVAVDSVKACTDSIWNMTGAWIEYVKTNTLEGATVDKTINAWDEFDHGLIDGSSYNNLKDTKLITFTSEEIGLEVTRGLKDSTSATTIQTTFGNYLDDVKTKVNSFMESVDPKDAFFGEQQAAKLREYIKKVGEEIGVITTAANDLYQALSVHAGSNFTTQDQSMSTSLESGISNIESNINVAGDSRWNGSN